MGTKRSALGNAWALTALLVIGIGGCAALEGLDRFEQVDQQPNDIHAPPVGTTGTTPAPTSSGSTSGGTSGTSGDVPTTPPPPVREAGVDDAGSSGLPPRDSGSDPPPPDPTNLARGGLAIASYRGLPADGSATNDGSLGTSWQAPIPSCEGFVGGQTASYTCTQGPIVAITLSVPSLVATVKLFSTQAAEFNHVVTFLVELLDANGTAIGSAGGTTTNGNATVDVSKNNKGVATAVRITVLTADGPSPGIAEVEVYAAGGP